MTEATDKKTAPRKCEYCGKAIEWKRGHKRFCDPRCQQRAWIAKHPRMKANA